MVAVSVEKDPKLQEDIRRASGAPSLRGESLDSLTRSGATVVLQQLRQSLRAAQKKGDRDALAWCLLNIAMVLRSQREYPAAIKILEEARGIFSTVDNSFGLASAYAELSVCNRELSRNALALEYANNAVGTFQTLKRDLEVAYAYDNLAVIHFNRFQRQESLVYAKRARDIFRAQNCRHGLAWNACSLGNLYFEMGFFSRAGHYFTEAHDLFGELKSKQGQAWSLFGLSRVRRAQSRYKEAEGHLVKARGYFSELELKDRMGWCVLNIAAIKRMTGRVDEALSMNKKALRVFGPLRNHDGVAWGFFQVGQLHRERGQLVKAWQTLREAMNLHSDILNRSGMGWAENEIGKTYLELNDAAHARECFVKVDAVADELATKPLKAEVSKNLAVLCLDEGRFEKALEYLSAAEAGAQKIHSREILAEVHLARARYWLLLGDTGKARGAVDAASSDIEHYDLVRLKPSAGVVLGEILLLEGKRDKAIETWQETTQLSKKLRQRRQRVEALFGILEAQRDTRTPAQLSLALFEIEKEIRALGSRKLKAKFVLLKALMALKNNGAFDSRVVSQAAGIAGSAGLLPLQRIVLEVALKAARQAGKAPEALDIERELAQFLEKSPPELSLVRLPIERSEILPVSVVA